MNKKSFSIIELLIAISIIGIIFMLAFQMFEYTQKSQIVLGKKVNNEITKDLIVKLLYFDFLNITDINELEIDKSLEANSHTVSFHTTNSIYDRIDSYLQFSVNSDNVLIRAESGNEKDNNRYIDLDYILSDIELFKVYKEEKDGDLFIFIKTKKDSIYFEVKSRNIIKPKKKEEVIPSNVEIGKANLEEENNESNATNENLDNDENL